MFLAFKFDLKFFDSKTTDIIFEISKSKKRGSLYTVKHCLIEYLLTANLKREKIE